MNKILDMAIIIGYIFAGITGFIWSLRAGWFYGIYIMAFYILFVGFIRTYDKKYNGGKKHG